MYKSISVTLIAAVAQAVTLKDARLSQVETDSFNRLAQSDMDERLLAQFNESRLA